LHIRHVPGGHFTDHVFAAMKERDILRINGPHGSFFLREESDKPILLIAGGTGFAPIKALVEHAIAEECKRPMSIYWGGHQRRDLYAMQLAGQWAAEHSHIRFTPVLAGSAPEDAWSGCTGLVHEVAMTDFPDLSGHQVYVCGAPGLIAAARRDFTGQCHLPEDEFFSDAFDFSTDPTNKPD
jgi:CDP-4-dehydro-6-deoxyglucose reductase